MGDEPIGIAVAMSAMSISSALFKLLLSVLSYGVCAQINTNGFYYLRRQQYV